MVEASATLARGTLCSASAAPSARFINLGRKRKLICIQTIHLHHLLNGNQANRAAARVCGSIWPKWKQEGLFWGQIIQSALAARKLDGALVAAEFAPISSSGWPAANNRSQWRPAASWAAQLATAPPPSAEWSAGCSWPKSTARTHLGRIYLSPAGGAFACLALEPSEGWAGRDRRRSVRERQEFEQRVPLSRAEPNSWLGLFALAHWMCYWSQRSFAILLLSSSSSLLVRAQNKAQNNDILTIGDDAKASASVALAANLIVGLESPALRVAGRPGGLNGAERPQVCQCRAKRSQLAHLPPRTGPLCSPATGLCSARSPCLRRRHFGRELVVVGRPPLPLPLPLPLPWPARVRHNSSARINYGRAHYTNARYARRLSADLRAPQPPPPPPPRTWTWTCTRPPVRVPLLPPPPPPTCWPGGWAAGL